MVNGFSMKFWTGNQAPSAFPPTRRKLPGASRLLPSAPTAALSPTAIQSASCRSSCGSTAPRLEQFQESLIRLLPALRLPGRIRHNIERPPHYLARLAQRAEHANADRLHQHVADGRRLDGASHHGSVAAVR